MSAESRHEGRRQASFSLRRLLHIATVAGLLPLICRPGSCQANKKNGAADEGVIHSRRLSSGIPLGGIGCGTFDIMSDGSISHATINNNWDKPTGDMKGCFAAIWTDSNGRKQAKALQLANPYGIPTVGGVDYRGMFPQAFMDFPDKDLPVQVSLRAFSPLIPHDILNSSVPAAIFVFKVTNLARAPVSAALAISWENFLGVGGSTADGVFAGRTGNSVAPEPASAGFIGLRFSAPNVPSQLPADRLRYNASANASYGLMVHATEPDWKVTRGSWNALDSKPAWWASFTADGTVPDDHVVGREGQVHPAGVVCAKFPLKDRETKTVAFAVSWYTPTFWTLSGQEYGHRYMETFPDASAVCRYVLENRLTLEILTDEWQNELKRSTLPPWLVRRLINDASALFTNTILTRNSGKNGQNGDSSLFAFLEAPGQGRGLLGAMDLSIAGYPMAADWFPDLWVRQLRLAKSTQSQDGGIPVHCGNIDSQIGVTTDQSVSSQRLDTADTSCAFAFEVLRHFLKTGDQKFLDEFYPAAKHAIEFVNTLDMDKDGLPDSPCVFDRAKSISGGAYTASVWIGALICARKLAAIMEDRRFEDQSKQWLDRAVTSANDRLWNQKFLKASVSEVGHVFQTYQLAGQWIANSVDESAVFPARFTMGALAEIIAFQNRSPASIPPRETDFPSGAAAGPWLPFAETFQAAILAQSGHTSEGLELMRAIDKLVDVAGTPWRVPIEVDSSGKAEPKGERSLASTASWSYYSALVGTTVDMKSATLIITPHIPSARKEFVAPVFLPSITSTVEVHQGVQRSSVSFRLNRFLPLTDRPTVLQQGAGLVIKQVVLPSSRGASMVSASVGRAPVPGKMGLDREGRLTFSFDAPIRLTAGQRVEFVIRYQ